MTDKLTLVNRIVHAYNTADMETLFPYLSEDVVRYSAWYEEPIVGKLKVMEYLLNRQEVQRTTTRIFARLGLTQYKSRHNGDADERIYLHPSLEMVQLQYPDQDPIVILQEYPNAPDYALVIIKLDGQGLIQEFRLESPVLYNYCTYVLEEGPTPYHTHTIAKIILLDQFRNEGLKVEVCTTPIPLRALSISDPKRRYIFFYHVDWPEFTPKVPDYLLKDIHDYTQKIGIECLLASYRIIPKQSNSRTSLNPDDYILKNHDVIRFRVLARQNDFNTRKPNIQA